jgi:hypothetical protein
MTEAQDAMGWYGYHLYDFDIDGLSYTDEETAEEYGGEVARGVRLNALVIEEGARFLYTYDFGDNWQHLVELEKILSPEPGAHYPRCIAGRRACPPEDVGGIWGYEEFLAAIKDPTHPDHRDMPERAGEEFDPAAFDLDDVNRGFHRA